MNLKSMLMIGFVLTFGAFAVRSESLDPNVSAPANIEALLFRITAKVGTSDSHDTKLLEDRMAQSDALMLQEGKEIGLPGPNRSTQQAFVAGKMAINALSRGKMKKTDEDINKLLDILERSYVAEKGTLGAPYSALTYATLCFEMKRYGESLVWLDRASGGLKKCRLLSEIESAKADVLRECRDSLKFTGCIAGAFSGTKGWKYEFKLTTPNTGGAIFEGYNVTQGDTKYSIKNVRQGTYLLSVYERRDGDLEPFSFVCAKNVTVEEGKVSTYDLVLNPRINLLSPEHGKMIIFKNGGVLAFKWEMPAVAKTGVVYDIRIQVPASSTPYPNGLKGTCLGRMNVNGQVVEIPVSEFREKGEYSWSVDMLDEKDNRNPSKPLARSGVRTFVVE